MEMSQETPCDKKKMSFFFFYKIKEQEDGTGPAWGVGGKRS
jgi:hypothetical protein